MKYSMQTYINDMIGMCHILLSEKGNFSKESIHDFIDDQKTNGKKKDKHQINSKKC